MFSAKRFSFSKEEESPVTTTDNSEYSKGVNSYGALNDKQKELMEELGIHGRYDTEKLTTYKVLGMTHATVFQNAQLWKEAGMLALVFLTIFFGVLHYRVEGFSKIIGSEAGIRAFLGMFSTLIGLLLSFYTALTLGRWWNMRLGVCQIQGACKELTMMIAHGVTQDKVLLTTIQRYTRASLHIIFQVSQHEPGMEHPIRKTLEIGLLSQEEVDLLEKLCPTESFVQAETLWIWIGNAVSKLNKQGLTAGAPHYCKLMGAVDSGRSGISTIKTYLDTPIPLGYVHLLCFMVKLHNLLLNILLALTAVMLSGGAQGVQPVGVFRTAFKAFFMPFLYNSILILNSDVTDPFGGDAGDFDFNVFDTSISMTSKSYTLAADDLPEWVTKAKFEPWAP